jgi:hypothetical protein
MLFLSLSCLLCNPSVFIKLHTCIGENSLRVNVKKHGSVTLTADSINRHSYTGLLLDNGSVHVSEVQTCSLVSLGDVCEQKYTAD